MLEIDRVLPQATVIQCPFRVNFDLTTSCDDNIREMTFVVTDLVFREDYILDPRH